MKLHIDIEVVNQVLGWVWANPATSQATIEAQIQQNIDNQIANPVVTPPLPWSA